MACMAYITASEDPKRGNGKKKDVFVSQIHKEYTHLCQEKVEQNPGISFHARTGEAVLQRYKKERAECLQFEGILYSIRQKKPTGSPSEADMERAALAVYNGEANISNMYSYFSDPSLETGPGFPFHHALKYLRRTSTWELLLLSRETKSNSVQPKTSNNPAGSVDNHEQGHSNSSNAVVSSGRGSSNLDHATEDVKRPFGAKRATDSAKKVHMLHHAAEGIEKLAAASAQRNKISQELLELQRENAKVEKKKYEISLFAMEGTDPEKRKRFLDMLQEEALNEMKAAKKKRVIELNPNPRRHSEKECDVGVAEDSDCLDLVGK